MAAALMVQQYVFLFALRYNYGISWLLPVTSGLLPAMKQSSGLGLITDSLLI